MVAAGGAPSAVGFVIPHALKAVAAANIMKVSAATRTCICRRGIRGAGTARSLGGE
jgi:hypothetical protein